MAEGEREQDRAPEQMKPKVFVGNHQQMLRDIKQSLKHLTRQPEVKNSQQPNDSAIKTTSAIFEPTNQASGLSNKPMVHNPSRRFSGHARALAEIRSSLKPFEATESGYSSCNEGQSCTQPESINKQVLDQLRAAGVEEESVTEAWRLTPGRTVEEKTEAIQMMAANNGYSRVNFGSNASSGSRIQLPPPYNAAVHRMPWRESQESLNNSKREESPMMGIETSAQIGPPPVIRTVSPAGAQVTSSESMKAEWRVHNVAAVTPQPWQGPPRVLTPGQQGYGERSGWYPTVSSVSTPGISQPPPQFQVTAQLNLSGNKVVDDCQGQGGRTNGAVNSASPMSFNILVKTNFPTSSSASVRPSSQGQYSQTAAQHMIPSIVQGSRADFVSHSNSPVSTVTHTPVPHFVGHPPPAYAPVAKRPVGCSDVNMPSNNWQNYVPHSSSRSPVPPPDQRRNSWNTETSSNSGSISDEMPWSSSYNDSSPPSPLSDSSYNFEGPSRITNLTGTVVYRLDSPNVPKRLPIPHMDSQDSGVPFTEEDDQMSESDMETLPSGQRLRLRKNLTPTATKFYFEQHFENVMKSTKERHKRRAQLEEEMQMVGLSQDARNQMRQTLWHKESIYNRLKRTKMDITMFEKINKIGTGAFGEVWLVRKIDTNMLYAMKILRKSEVLKRNQVAHVKAERDILAEADNEWVVKLYFSFQDEKFLYFVMDYIPGGDLMSLLIKRGIFPENLAKFYIAELVLAIESVHRMGFVHRDIKPDNVLIDKDGHIKLTDFGLCTGFRWTHETKYYQKGDHERQQSLEDDMHPWNAMDYPINYNEHLIQKPLLTMKPLERKHFRKNMRSLAHSLVGTPNYIAPEVLMRSGYTQLCDWWSVGVIMYEMLVGQPPFMANSPADTQLKVINWEKTLHIPKQAELSLAARDLILRLCTSQERRLGVNGVDEIKSHPWFHSVDWSYGVRRMQAPHRPLISSPTDTSNFDAMEEPERISSDEEATLADNDCDEASAEPSPQRQGRHQEHAFYEFTFRRFFNDGGINCEPSRHYSSDDSCSDSTKEPVYV